MHGMKPESAHVDLVIEPGTREDVARLAAFHYRSSSTPSAVRILRAVERPGPGKLRPELAGVVVVACATLNGAWRRSAWPTVFGASTPRADAARRLNATLRRIARVIVEPRYRGLGVGTRLVRAYLADPITPLTEAVSAHVGAASIFLGAGMREVVRPPAPELEALSRALAQLGVRPGGGVLLSHAEALVRTPEGKAAAEALASRGRAWRSLRHRGGGDEDAALGLARVLAAGAAALVARPRVFVAGGES
jgi:GNAT superfamily N-acetyltransferase